MDQKGGRLLGAGVDGCTFSPTPRCENGKVITQINDMPAVGKITAENIEDEFSIGKEIMLLPNASKYFALPTVECTPHIPVSNINTHKCKLLEDNYTNFSMMVMPYAGVPLSRWAYNLHVVADSFEQIFIHLLEGMIIYQDAGIIHNDIHNANIIVDASNVARYIDMGRAFKLSKVRTIKDTHMGNSFRPKYVYVAPELHIWRMISNRIQPARGFRQMIHVNHEYYDLVHYFPTRPRPELVWMKMIETTESFRKRDIRAFMMKYGKRCDSWRIGLCMWTLWSDLMNVPGTLTKSDLWEKKNPILRAINGLTDVDIDARWDARRALREIDPMNTMAKEKVELVDLGGRNKTHKNRHS